MGSVATPLYYGGVEGGASVTTFTLMDCDGNVLSTSKGECTNQYLIGLEECLHRIHLIVQDGLSKAGLHKATPLEGIGLSLSGGDEPETQESFRERIRTKYPNLARHIFIGSDTMSALATAFPNGGIVLIAGTGSNCQLINGDGTMARSGGWGHMIGDESSACWITLRAIKTLFDHYDKVVLSEHCVENVKRVVLEYFQIKKLSCLLDHLYKDFNKTFFSGCCKYLAAEASETKDPLICSLFHEAGQYLAKHLSALADNISKELKEQDGGVPIVCVGSVFKSWDLLQAGFSGEMTSRQKKTGIKEVTLYSLQANASVGAAALGAKAAGKELAMNYSSTAKAFYHCLFSTSRDSVNLNCCKLST